MPQVLIYLDHLMLAILFIIAMFCVLAAANANVVNGNNNNQEEDGGAEEQLSQVEGREAENEDGTDESLTKTLEQVDSFDNIDRAEDVGLMHVVEKDGETVRLMMKAVGTAGTTKTTNTEQMV